VRGVRGVRVRGGESEFVRRVRMSDDGGWRGGGIGKGIGEKT
jgi:hypothetical protein